VAEIPTAVEAELARLRAENARLLKLLKLTPQQAAPPGPAQASSFEAPPGLVHHRSAEDDKVAFFGALFAARTDVYAIRFDNHRTGKRGWAPAVRGGWQKGVRHEDRAHCYQETIDGGLVLPRGMLGTVTSLGGQAGSRLNIIDQRSPAPARTSPAPPR
jgi:hypothetical protein